MGEEVVVDERVHTGRTTNIGQTGKTGWSMGDEALERANGSLPWSASGQIPVMSINGFPRINSPATGAPVIGGLPVWGLTLEAHTRTIRDDRRQEQGSRRYDADYAYTYQWERVDADGALNPEEIAGATGKTYTVTNADIGRALRVKVSFTDDADFDEGPLTSDARAGRWHGALRRHLVRRALPQVLRQLVPWAATTIRRAKPAPRTPFSRRTGSPSTRPATASRH